MKKLILTLSIAFAVLGLASAAEANATPKALPAVTSLVVSGSGFSINIPATTVNNFNDYIVSVPSSASVITIKAIDGDANVVSSNTVSVAYGQTLVPLTLSSEGSNKGAYSLVVVRSHN